MVDTPISTIVVAMDNTPCGRAAARWAVLRAAQTGGSVRIVHAWDLPATPAAQLEHDLGHARSEVQSRLDAWVADALDGLHVEVPTVVQVLAGDIATVLSRAARDAETLVVGEAADGGHPVLDRVALRPSCDIVLVDESGHARHLGRPTPEPST